MKYDERHQGPYDTGSADYYYHRPFDPHYFESEKFGAKRITIHDPRSPEYEAYEAGYNAQLAANVQKDYGDEGMDREIPFDDEDPGYKPFH